jgi:hypothetical protein
MGDERRIKQGAGDGRRRRRRKVFSDREVTRAEPRPPGQQQAGPSEALTAVALASEDDDLREGEGLGVRDGDQ